MQTSTTTMVGKPKPSPVGIFLQWVDDNPAFGLGLVFLILPFVVPQTALLTQIMTFGLFAVSFNLLLGYTGLLSFGHSTYLGLGSYAAALFLIKTKILSVWLALLVGVAVPVLGAIVIGWFCLRRRLVYFAMLTLAFNQMVYFVFFQMRGLTGGDDGLRGIPIPPLTLPGITPSIDSIQFPLRFYFFVYLLVVLCLLAVQRIIQSPFGRALQAIRESEERARAIGYDTDRLQHLSVLFAGCFAGVAGALNALLFGFVALESLSWLTAGIVVIMTILGGRGTFVGPVIGAAIYIFIQEYASRVTVNWPLIFGGLFVLIVMFLPQGIWGTFKEWYKGRQYPMALEADHPQLSEAEPVNAAKD